MLFETAFTPPVFGLRREIDRLFDDVLNRTSPSTSWMPPVDVREDDTSLVMAVEVPGIPADQIEVTTDNGMLTIRGEKHAERKEGDKGQYHLVERTYGSFTRSFRLPKGVDESKISADIVNGVLEVRVPKTALPQPKKIAIGSGASSNDGNKRDVSVTGTSQSANAS